MPWRCLSVGMDWINDFLRVDKTFSVLGGLFGFLERRGCDEDNNEANTTIKIFLILFLYYSDGDDALRIYL